MITQTFDLNMIPDSSPVVVHVNQYDAGTGRLIAKLYKGESVYTPAAGATAIIQGTKPDGRGFNYNASLSGNTVTADLTEQMTACAGDVRCQIVVTETSGRTGSFAFTLSVQKSALPSDTDMSASDYQIIEELIEDVQEAVGTATQSASDAEAWAVGERGGEPVPPTDPTYQNNAEYWAHYAEEHGSVPVMTGSILGIGSPDDLTTIATNGIITAKGVAISATVNPSGTEHGANWLKHGTTVLTPDSEQMYLVYIDNAPTLWTWDGTAYVQISGGGGPTGSTIMVTTTETTLFGEDVTLTDGTSTLTETFDNTGTAVFTGVTMTGTLTAESTDGSSTATGTVTITDPGTYTVQINFWIATINITTDSPDMYGQTITVKNSNNVTVATTTFSNQGTASVTVGSADIYTVSCLTESDNVTVSAQTTYTVNLHLWTATLSISTSDSSLYGEPIDIQRGETYVGRTTFSNAGTASYNVHDTGTYYVTCQGNTETVTVSAETTYNVVINAIPDGSTVTPTDDIQTWLACAGLSESYTTLSQVLSDRATLYALIKNNNATDYLVRSTTWASDLTADEYAMKYIGRWNYASNELLSNSTWRTAICNSTYFESVLNAKVPVMTSSTTPSGVASASTEYTSSYGAYKAFDRNSSTYWCTTQNSITNQYVEYEFPNPVSIAKVSILNNNEENINPKNCKIQYYDGTQYIDVKSFVNSGTPSAETSVCVDILESAKKWRVFIQDNYGNTAWIYIVELQFYGRTDVIENTIDIYSAASDTVYYMDNGSPVTVCTTDTSGHGTVAKANLPNGTYTLYSTVAKDPSNLSNAFSKSVTVSDNTTDIYLTPTTPDKMFYWYGNTFGGTFSDQGYSNNGQTLSGTVDYQTNAIVQDTRPDGTGPFVGTVNKKSIPAGLTKGHVIEKWLRTQGSGYNHNLVINGSKNHSGAANTVGTCVIDNTIGATQDSTNPRIYYAHGTFYNSHVTTAGEYYVYLRNWSGDSVITTYAAWFE